MALFKGISGNVTLDGANGKHTFSFEGSKVPDEAGALGGYVGELVQKAIVGLAPAEVSEIVKQNKELKAQVDKLIAEGKKK
jgi:hypothetical protein